MKSIKSETQRLPFGDIEDTVAFLATNWEKNLKKILGQTLVYAPFLRLAFRLRRKSRPAE